MKNKLSISIITCTLNADLAVFKKSLESIKKQRYPKNLVEHIVMDGGSTNGTIKLAREYNCKVHIRKDLLKQEMTRQSIGIKKAKGGVLLMLPSDNILTSEDWLEKMTEPFKQNKKVFCTFSAYNSFEKNMSLITRYTAFFGAPHPVLYFLGKSDKIPMTQKKYDKGKIVNETQDNYIVEFSPDNLPTCGDNGHMILKKAMDTVNTDPDTFAHLDAMLELVQNKYSTFGVVKNSIIHIGKNSIVKDVRRKMQLKNEFYDKRRGKRKYSVFNWHSNRDRINLLKYVIFSLTFVYPLYQSIKGYLKVKDSAWFIHPIFCLLMLVGLGYSEIKWFANQKLM
ncbi:MAG: Glycosyl transferase [Microgenomates group bacterium GW2011_GWA2_37_6]|nr:MAG: Glycosyl transferase [Microgenomates group bacterium GW2011_GWA2_37_6]